MTMNDTWGFSRNDHNWKSSTTLIRNRVNCASKGGNYLLNVGPMADGVIPPVSQDILRRMNAQHVELTKYVSRSHALY